MTLPFGTEYERLLSSLRLEIPWAIAHLEVGASSGQFDAKPPDSAMRDIAAPTLLESDRKKLLLDTIERLRTGRAATDDAPWTSACHLISAYARMSADCVAVADGNNVISYGDLDQRTDALAAALRTYGVSPGSVVAVALPRSITFIETVLAVWKAHAAYLPLNPDTPTAWRADAAKRAGASVCIAESMDTIPGLRHIDPRQAQILTAAAKMNQQTTDVQPHDLAYVIYTSGSTGKPKLVMVEHQGVRSLIRAQRDHLPNLGTESRILQFSPSTFDASIFELLLSLGHGGRLDILDKTTTDRTLEDILRERKITHAVLTAAVIRTLEPEKVPDLQVLLSVGDVCMPETARRWSRTLHFINAYGPTEASVWTTFHAIEGEDDIAKRVPIGRAINGSHVVIVNELLNPVPDGAIGEICIGGDNVGRGYLGEPRATAERFVPDPFSPVPGSRLYRTGDIGRYLAGGAIEFIGRQDTQVKIRGFRIDLAEIETALATLPGVGGAVALADGADGEKRLVGFVAPKSGEMLDGETVRATLSRQLPDYMTPSIITVLHEFPLNSSGKVDRTRLSRLSARAVTEYVAPRTPVEQILAQIAADLLGLERISIHDNFFARGGHSLLAAQFAARARTALNKDISLSTILQGATIARLATALTNRVDAQTAGPELASRPDQQPVPSFAQERAWLVHALDPTALAYNAQTAIRLILL